MFLLFFCERCCILPANLKKSTILTETHGFLKIVVELRLMYVYNFYDVIPVYISLSIYQLYFQKFHPIQKQKL